MPRRTSSRHGREPKFAVEPSRFAFAEVMALQAAPTVQLSAASQLAAQLSGLKIDLGELVFEIEKTAGNVSYEEVVDIGLDTNREKLVATYHVKKPSGFSGGFCSAGSTEYVAFWADWNDTCSWEYLDTVSLAAYDFDELPDGGLCYSVELPVDIEEFKRKCQDPKVARVRAVLSWNSAPSTTDADQVPTWGNRLDAHVLLPARVAVAGRLKIVGGVQTSFIDNSTGMASGAAVFQFDGMPVYSPLGLPVPFGGRIVIQGLPIMGARYRLRVVDSGGGSQTLTKKVWIGFGPLGPWNVPDADGWFNYLSQADNIDAVLGYFDSTGNDTVTIRLEIEGVGVVDTQRVKLDNTRPEVAISITDPVGDCGTIVPGVTMKGRVHATDAHMGAWHVEIDGGPATFSPVPATTGATGFTNTPAGGVEWTYKTEASMADCGYVVRVVASDRAIVGSGHNRHSRSVDVGFCVRKD